MSIKATLTGALALLTTVVPSLALAQPPGVYIPGRVYGGYEAYPPPEPSYTSLNIAPPAYGSVYVYEGRRLIGRFDGPGALWVTAGRVYRAVAMRSDQVVWSGDLNATGAPLELRWPQAPACSPSAAYPYATEPAYPARPLTPPIERGRIRTPQP